MRAIIHIDADPLKQQMPLWYIGASLQCQADAAQALAADPRGARSSSSRDPERIERARAASRGRARGLASGRRARASSRATKLTAEYLVALHSRGHRRGRHRRQRGRDQLPRGVAAPAAHAARAPCSRAAAARWATTAAPRWASSSRSRMRWWSRSAATVPICSRSRRRCTGWRARYQAPFLHVVLNNGGWRAPRQAVLSVHPDGIAAQSPKIDIDFPQPPDYAGIAAAAGGAHAETRAQRRRGQAGAGARAACHSRGKTRARSSTRTIA